MSKFANKQFWIDTGDRALASFAQAILATGALNEAGVLSVDWVQIVSLAGSYAVASVLTSISFRGGDQSEDFSGRHADV